jgi:DNA repair exonuclease SbcCD ATPase subunit
MPRPHNERQSLEKERAELRGQIAACWQERENGSPHRARREQLEWQIRKAENRLAELAARLAAIRAEGP